MFDQNDELRIFTLEEAQSMLPELRSNLLMIQEEKKKLDQLRRELRRLTPAMRGNGHAEEASDLDQQIRSKVDVLRDRIEAITDQGVLLKDIDNGIVDFPARREGRVVLLCWMISEPEIAHWHELDAGFQGRQPL
ncbi:MAG: DUF2203 domain-containing protein [Chloroflexota bacterium]